MKMTLNTKEMKEILKRAKKAIPKQNIKPIISGIKIRPNGTMITTDMETVTVFFPEVNNIEGQGTTVIDVSVFKSLVDKIKSPRFNLEIEPNKVVITYQNITMKIPVMNPDDYPEVEIPEEGQDVLINREELYQGLTDVLFTASTDDMIRNLNGVLFEIEGHTLRMVTADSYRMSVKEIRLNTKPFENMKQFFISLKAAKQIHEGLKITQGVNVGFDFSNKHLNVFLGSAEIDNRKTYKCCFRIITKYMDVSFPNYKAVLPESFQTVATFNRQELLEAITTAEQIAKGKGDTIKFELNGSMKVVTRSQDRGDFEAVLTGTREGKENTIAFDPCYIIESLKHFKNDDVVFSFVDENNALQITEPDQYDYLNIIMPVKIRQ
jgi:DNA polymerase-3 subunit beta